MIEKKQHNFSTRKHKSWFYRKTNQFEKNIKNFGSIKKKLFKKFNYKIIKKKDIFIRFTIFSKENKVYNLYKKKKKKINLIIKYKKRKCEKKRKIKTDSFDNSLIIFIKKFTYFIKAFYLFNPICIYKINYFCHIFITIELFFSKFTKYFYNKIKINCFILNLITFFDFFLKKNNLDHDNLVNYKKNIKFYLFSILIFLFRFLLNNINQNQIFDLSNSARNNKITNKNTVFIEKKEIYPEKYYYNSLNSNNFFRKYKNKTSEHKYFVFLFLVNIEKIKNYTNFDKSYFFETLSNNLSFNTSNDFDILDTNLLEKNKKSKIDIDLGFFFVMKIHNNNCCKLTYLDGFIYQFNLIKMNLFDHEKKKNMLTIFKKTYSDKKYELKFSFLRKYINFYKAKLSKKSTLNDIFLCSEKKDCVFNDFFFLNNYNLNFKDNNKEYFRLRNSSVHFNEKLNYYLSRKKILFTQNLFYPKQSKLRFNPLFKSFSEYMELIKISSISKEIFLNIKIKNFEFTKDLELILYSYILNYCFIKENSYVFLNQVNYFNFLICSNINPKTNIEIRNFQNIENKTGYLFLYNSKSLIFCDNKFLFKYNKRDDLTNNFGKIFKLNFFNILFQGFIIENFFRKKIY
ncbi:hypothetical protein [Guillardia theta]|uniref:Uncharacterized protein n=1 Tax=Guillardia theta TaxID=55529 RepID=Q9AW87_GUITH|nr:hypothetical protein GTHECHR2134 [Guillardia theta]CAC26982.1 hypothetical protein [Guillardia theta]